MQSPKRTWLQSKQLAHCEKTGSPMGSHSQGNGSFKNYQFIRKG